MDQTSSILPLYWKQQQKTSKQFTDKTATRKQQLTEKNEGGKANNGGKEESKHERQGDRAGQRDRAIKVGVGQGSHIARQGGREVSKQ